MPIEAISLQSIPFIRFAFAIDSIGDVAVEFQLAFQRTTDS